MKGKYNARSKSLGTRVRKLESKVRAAKPELKAYQDCTSLTTLLPGAFYFVPLVNFGQGTGQSQRIGHEISVRGFRLHNSTSNDVMSSMLIRSVDGLAPVPSDFLACQHTQLVVAQSHIFKVMKYLYNFSGQNHQVTHYTKRYKQPLKVGYNNVGQVVKNGLWLVIYNAGAAPHDFSFTWTVWYTDS